MTVMPVAAAAARRERLKSDVCFGKHEVWI
jgi:hypothetical protein